MAQRPAISVENNFIGGLKTEFSGLNFPENACADVDNCNFSILGTVSRREGYDYEDNFTLSTINRSGKAVNSYTWLNAGGDGLTQVVVQQTGNILSFYLSSSATVANPLSSQKLTSTVDISTFLPVGSSKDPSITECQFTDGNGYLFVYHPSLDPFYCTYVSGTITGYPISLQIRDFAGIEDGLAVNFRPSSLSGEHKYNLQNQGWTSGGGWAATSSTTVTVGTPQIVSFVVNETSLPVNLGDQVTCIAFNPYQVPIGYTALMTGNVVYYSGTDLHVSVYQSNAAYDGRSLNDWSIGVINVGFISTWQGVASNYPSNSDVWWTFKDSTGVFNPATTYNSVTLNAGRAAQGHYILNAFNQDRSLIAAIDGLTSVTTSVRPKTGTWFQGRVWYTGVDASQAATGDASHYTWSENIYFSQIVETISDFGLCYQTNDPTDQNLFAELPSDGGVVRIQGCGSIYKLFPIQNGMLVFAANGIWFITGSQGIGFTANDYTITKISSVKSISCTSYVDVNGLPMFWNEEGIYMLAPSQQGLGLVVNPLTVGTILSFYNEIPASSKKFARGFYNPIDYTVQWLFKSQPETDVTTRYEFDKILNFNSYTKAFFPYTISYTPTSPKVNGILYVSSPGGTASPDPVFKYVTSVPFSSTYKFTFSEENSDTYEDWFSNDNVGLDFDSFFVTGYKLHGQGIRKWQPEYVYMYSDGTVPTIYKIQSIWDFANSGNSGRYSQEQLITNGLSNFGTVFRKHRLRGHGLALQIRVSSATGYPFEIIGWAMSETQNASV